MVIKSKTAYQFFWPNILLFTLAGIWTPYFYDPETSLRKRAYRWYHRIVIVICVTYIVQGVVEVIRKSSELSIDDKSEFYSYVVQLGVGLLKIYFLDRNEARMRKMFQEIEGKPFQRNNDEVFNAKLGKRMRTNIKIMVLFWLPIYTTVGIKLMTSYMASRANILEFESVCLINGNETIPVSSSVDCASYPKLVMPWLTWFPFATDKSPGHQIGIAYQVIVLTIFASYIFNFDMYITSWMMYIAFQLELMEHDLMTLRENSEGRVMETKGSQHELLITQEMEIGIRKIISLHNEILRWR